MTERPPSPSERCAGCGVEFVCGARAGAQACWCAALPPLAPRPGASCLCRACLEEALRQELRDATRYST